jgi:hypothetical protein
MKKRKKVRYGGQAKDVILGISSRQPRILQKLLRRCSFLGHPGQRSSYESKKARFILQSSLKGLHRPAVRNGCKAQPFPCGNSD